MGQPRVGRRAWEGWWGDDPPYHRPVFVITHHEREPLHKSDTTFTFVTDGIESALEQARQAAGDRDIALGGGADVAQQYLGQSATPARTSDAWRVASTNLELVRRGYDAFSAGDLEAWLALLDPEVEWRMAEDEPDRRTFRGRDGVLALLAENLELWSEISFDVEEVLELDEDWVLVVTTLRGVGKGSEVPIEQPESHLIRLRAGRAVRVEEYRHKADALAAVRGR